MAPGSEPLKPRYESLCEAVSRGVSAGAAWLATMPSEKRMNASQSAARVSAHRILAKPEVKERIAFLRIQNAASVVKHHSTTGSLSELAYLSVDALLEAHERAEVSLASPATLSSIRAAIDTCIGRARMLDSIPSKDSDGAGEFDIIAAAQRVRSTACQCV